MIVERITWPLKPGSRDEAIELGKANELPNGSTYRIYSFMFGGDDETVGVELEFESMEDREKWWAEWASRPKNLEVAQELQQLMLSGGIHELLRLH